ncbi:uncharacterized protein PG998_014605 [Apiospora kogelbergensis]|uniref:uncharacterized protein n=1 Tax=Apiospora kogelbergensis TaxID=1337665 RepID=UPI003130CD58
MTSFGPQPARQNEEIDAQLCLRQGTQIERHRQLWQYDAESSMLAACHYASSNECDDGEETPSERRRPRQARSQTPKTRHPPRSARESRELATNAEAPNRCCTWEEPKKKRGVQTGYIRTLELALGWVFDKIPGSEEALHAMLTHEGGQGRSLLVGKDSGSGSRLHRRWRKSNVHKEIERVLSGGDVLDAKAEKPSSANGDSDSGDDTDLPYQYTRDNLASATGADYTDWQAGRSPACNTLTYNFPESLAGFKLYGCAKRGETKSLIALEATTSSTGAITTTLYAVVIPTTALAVTTTSNPTNPPTPIPTAPNDTSDDQSRGLSRSDKIALGCGIGIGLPATLAALFTCWRQLGSGYILWGLDRRASYT